MLKKNSLLKLLVFTLLLLPIIVLTAQFFQHRLGANPVETLTHETGKWALVCLLLSLSASPLKAAFGWKKIMQFRRMLGLYSFFYASLHFAIYWVFDQSLSFAYVWEDILDRPYITLGFSAWLLLIPLTITSTQSLRRKLGRRWLQLHKLVYLIGLLVIAHFIWLIRADYTEAILYSAWLFIVYAQRIIHSNR
ncbi:protein-methionine-sulfoxide reductase heme-binding subunit MsrQ [Teredinibacter purpureus]|uniref:sulfite oxidase heme-binding subunit YedZ n=1 Tax=Teredinibacter purpureus TaxID=2731756 RepID=UPI0005F79FAB|nr:protein-methionine-sulfoxide reductase heme-binding subunit MsrQ [Teredinibacter purpureus]